MYLNYTERVSSNLPVHFASLAVICGLATTVLMLKFLKFKASLNLSHSTHREDAENYPTTVENISLAGAYRVRKEEFFGNGSLLDPRKKITVDMVTLPPSAVRAATSTSDLTQPSDVAVTLRLGTPEVSMNPRGSIPHARDSTDNKQKQTKDKKLAGKREKEKKKEREKKKNKPPPPPPALPANPMSRLNNTNTLESSVSGPPPYSDVPDRLEVVPNRGDDTGNTSFGKRTEASSWDLVSQHREQVSRPVPTHRRNRAMDLKYSVGAMEGNSEV